MEKHEAVSAQLDELGDIEVAIDQIRRKLPIEERLRHLLALGTSVGTIPAEYSYILLAQVRRLTGEEATLGADLKELFRRMVFNVLIDNTDDHERNHGFLYDGGWRLAPAFDVSSQLTALGYQAMKVGADDTRSTLANALSECEHFGLRPEKALGLVNQLIDSTGALPEVYREAGVDPERVAVAARVRENIVSAFRARPQSDQWAPPKKMRTAVRKKPSNT